MPSRIISVERRRAFYMLLVAGAVAGMIALALTIAIALSGNTSSINDACLRVQKLEVVIHAVLVQSLRTLGVKGGPGYAYYRAHPAELAAARVSLRREISQFATRAC